MGFLREKMKFTIFFYLLITFPIYSAGIGAHQEELYIRLPTLVSPSHLRPFDKLFSVLVSPYDIDSARKLIQRIDRIFGEQLKVNPTFHRLISPLISIEYDDEDKDYQMSFIKSASRLSLLHLFLEKVSPPIFSYEEALKKLDRTSGFERYTFFMVAISTFSPSLDLVRTVWKNIFVINKKQFATVRKVVKFFYKDVDLTGVQWQHRMMYVFTQSFQNSEWSAAYWNDFIKEIELQATPQLIQVQ